MKPGALKWLTTLTPYRPWLILSAVLPLRTVNGRTHLTICLH